jgi:hypothetical protein
VELQKLHLYVPILGFNLLISCVVFLVWYYFTDFDVEIYTSPLAYVNKTDNDKENAVSKLTWLTDSITKYGGALKICTPHNIVGNTCDYEIPPMKFYQINSIVKSLQLTDIGSPSITFSTYSGLFEYNGRSYDISMRTNIDYFPYIISGLTSSSIGTLGIILIWKKLLPAYKQQPN